MLKKLLGLITILLIVPKDAYALETTAESTVLISADTRQILYNNNGFSKLGMASTTKIMTALIALENSNSNKIITVSQNAQNQEGSSIYLRAGDEVPLIDLLYGLMLNSGNDAAVAIAEGVGGSCENFVRMMNEKAEKLGCKNTNFKNPNGLSDPEHYSSCYDLALIMAHAMENETFAEIVATKEYQIKNKEAITYLKNHNKLLWQTDTCIGGKTGFTKLDGRCLVSCAEKDGKRVIAVTLNDKNDWKDHKILFEYGFEKLKNVEIIRENEILCTKTIRGAKVNILAGENLVIPLKNGKKRDLSCKINLDETLDGNIGYGTCMGNAEIYVGDYKVGKINIKSGQNIKQEPLEIFTDNLKYFLKFVLLKKRTEI